MAQMPFDQYSSLSDAELLQAYAQGAAGAAQVLTERLLPRVFGQAYRILNDRAEAEDVAQEAFLRLWKIAPDWDADRAKVTTWVYRIVMNLCTDRLRKVKNSALDDAPEVADDGQSAEAHLLEISRQKALYQALGTLPERQAQAMSLRHLEELSNPEIAEIMGLSVEAVESLLSRGKRGLKVALQAQQHALGYQDDPK